MDIVADTSILLAVVLNEPERKSIIQKTKGAQLYGPSVIPWEVGNAFSAMFKQKRIRLDQAKKAYEAFEKIPIQYIGVNVPLALEIAKSMDIYACDAYFFQCAIDCAAPIMSLDGAFVTKAKTMGLKVVEV